jgi:hypothetical protein
MEQGGVMISRRNQKNTEKEDDTLLGHCSLVEVDRSYRDV